MPRKDEKSAARRLPSSPPIGRGATILGASSAVALLVFAILFAVFFTSFASDDRLARQQEAALSGYASAIGGAAALGLLTGDAEAFEEALLNARRHANDFAALADSADAVDDARLLQSAAAALDALAVSNADPDLAHRFSASQSAALTIVETLRRRSEARQRMAADQTISRLAWSGVAFLFACAVMLGIAAALLSRVDARARSAEIERRRSFAMLQAMPKLAGDNAKLRKLLETVRIDLSSSIADLREDIAGQDGGALDDGDTDRIRKAETALATAARAMFAAAKTFEEGAALASHRFQSASEEFIDETQTLSETVSVMRDDMGDALSETGETFRTLREAVDAFYAAGRLFAEETTHHRHAIRNASEEARVAAANLSEAIERLKGDDGVVANAAMRLNAHADAAAGAAQKSGQLTEQTALGAVNALKRLYAAAEKLESVAETEHERAADRSAAAANAMTTLVDAMSRLKA